MKLQQVYLIFLLALVIYSCQDIEKTKSGIDITFVERGDEEFYKDSTFVLFLDIIYVDANGVELFNSVLDNREMTMQFNRATWGISDPFAGPFYEAITLCNVGDSIHFDLTAKQTFVETFEMDSVPGPLNLADDSRVSFYVGIADQMTEQEFGAHLEKKAEEERQAFLKEYNKRKLLQDSVIREYIKENGFTDMKRTKKGLWYSITKEGAGAKPEINDLLTIHYKGTLLDGTVFESTHEKGEADYFAFGVRDVIKGWDHGFGLLKVGSKATFIMPSNLGYNEESPGLVKPYSILRYDVELLKITKRGKGFIFNREEVLKY